MSNLRLRVSTLRVSRILSDDLWVREVVERIKKGVRGVEILKDDLQERIEEVFEEGYDMEDDALIRHLTDEIYAFINDRNGNVLDEEGGEQ